LSSRPTSWWTTGTRRPELEGRRHVAAVRERLHGAGHRGARKELAAVAPIERLQELSASHDKASIFYIRCDNPQNIDRVSEEIHTLFPRHQLRPVREFMSMMTSSRIPGLDNFVNSMIALAVVVGVLVIFLSLYTTILERTRGSAS
jgi:putative ABC transport system permease protein